MWCIQHLTLFTNFLAAETIQQQGYHMTPSAAVRVLAQIAGLLQGSQGFTKDNSVCTPFQEKYHLLMVFKDSNSPVRG